MMAAGQGRVRGQEEEEQVAGRERAGAHDGQQVVVVPQRFLVRRDLRRLGADVGGARRFQARIDEIRICRRWGGELHSNSNARQDS